jgi:hypothetical protein
MAMYRIRFTNDPPHLGRDVAPLSSDGHAALIVVAHNVFGDRRHVYVQ